MVRRVLLWAAAAALGLAGCAPAVSEWDPLSIPATVPDAPINRWQLVHEQAPNIMWENGIAWDPEARRIVWHGGHIGRLYPQSNYTYLYDPTANRFSESQSPVRPQRRCLVHVAYLDGAGRTITTDGGVHHGSIPEGRPNSDYRSIWKKDANGPWLYDSAADLWEDCRTLPPLWQRRAHAPVAYEPNSDALFGLRGGELFIYSPRLNRVFTRPLPKELHNLLGYGLAADPVRRKLVVFGGKITTKRPEQVNGKNVYDTVVNDFTWVYDIAADAWKQCAPKLRPPKGVPGHDMLSLQMVWHDPSGTVLLLQNSTDSASDNKTWPPAELWSFDAVGEEWTRVPVEAGGPRPAFMGLLAYARALDLLYLFGGGRDGTGEEGRPDARPALSRQVWSCRVRVPNRPAVPAPRPEQIWMDVEKDGVRLVWAADPGVQYEVFRAPADPLPGVYSLLPGACTQIPGGPATGRSFVDRSAEPGKVYAYQIGAVGAARRSLPAFNQPWRPAGLRASVESAKEVRLTWSPDSAIREGGYRVYRAKGVELDKGRGELLTPEPLREPSFTDKAIDLSDGVICSYWVTAVNRAGIESGASPLAYTVPDAPCGLAVPEGVGPSDGEGRELNYVVSWQWPAAVKVAGFNVYHATEHLNTLDTGYEPFWKLWSKINDRPVAGRELIFDLPKGAPPNHYFYVRAVNVLGQEGFYSDLVSPTDRRFRP